MTPDTIQRRKTRLINHLLYDHLETSDEKQRATRKKHPELFEDIRTRIE